MDHVCSDKAASVGKDYESLICKNLLRNFQFEKHSELISSKKTYSIFATESRNLPTVQQKHNAEQEKRPAARKQHKLTQAAFFISITSRFFLTTT